MTNTEIVANNRLIAEFMGWKEVLDVMMNSKLNKALNIEEFEYHTSWDWLMPVVREISNRKGVKIDFIYMLGGLKVNINKNDISSGWPNPNHIEAVYKSVVAFIKWYN